MLKWFSKRKTSESPLQDQNQAQESLSEVSESSALTDADYEFLFNQLLDGVANGWNQLRIIKFFHNLGTRGEEARWVAWLEKFSTKIPDVTNDSQRRLGAIMLRLAELTQSAAELSQLSAISAQIGKKLFFGKTANLVWEYDGLDVVTPSTSVRDEPTPDEDSGIEENMTPSSEPSEIVNSEPEDLEINSSENSEPDSNQLNQSEVLQEQSLDTTEIELVESWFNLGLTQANAGDFQGAIASWQQALELNPHLAEIWHNLGSALGRLEQYAEAIQSFDRALTIDPQSSQAWNDRAHAFYHLEQWEEAVNSWDKAIAINPDNHQFWYYHGCALEQLQQLDRAIASYTKALEISPDFQPARTKYVNLVTES